MKFLLPFVILLASISNAKSMCISREILVWPEAKEIIANQVFIINTSFTGRENILSQKYAMYLENEAGEKIQLKIFERHRGDWGRYQLLAKPERNLAIGTYYKLKIDNSYGLNYFTSETWKSKKGYLVAYSEDKLPPEWKEQPAFSSYIYQQYGCGPEEYVAFCASYKDQSPAWIKTRVRDKRTNKVTTFVIYPYFGSILVGHGMCGGPFSFEKDGLYEVSFRLMDAAGNTNSSFTAPFDFKSPELTGKPGNPNCPNRNETTRQYGTETPIYLISIICFLVFSLTSIFVIVRFRKLKR